MMFICYQKSKLYTQSSIEQIMIQSKCLVTDRQAYEITGTFN